MPKQTKNTAAAVTVNPKSILDTLTSKFWIKDATGKPSMSATFVTGAFTVTTIAYILSIFEKIGPLTIRPFDSAACSSYLIPLVTLYFGRKWTDSKLNNSQDTGEK